MGEPITIEIIQDGMVVASVTGRKDDAERQAAHYALIYGQDGPVEMRTKEPPMTDEDLEHAASALCRCQHLEPDALVMHRMKTMEAWESRVPFVKAVLAALAENLPDAMVEAGARAAYAHSPAYGIKKGVPVSIPFDEAVGELEYREAREVTIAALTAALNVKEG